MRFTNRLNGGSAVKNLPAMQDTRAQSLGREDPLEKEGATRSSSCLESPKDRGAWRAVVRGVVESGTTEPLSHCS